jgi:phage-related protein
MDLFDLAAKITLNMDQFEEGMKNAESEGSGFASKLKKGLGTAAKVGGTAIAAIGAGAVALGKSFYNGVSNLAAYGDQIDKNSQKMGISAQAYQEWDFILQHSGSSIDAMGRGMMTLSKQAESGSDAFERLGISTQDLAELNKEDLFAKTIEGLQALGEGTERDALAAELFGGSAKELGPLLNTTADDVAAMRQQVNDLNGVMGDDGVKNAAAFQDAMQNLQTAFDGIKRGFLDDFLPSFTTVIDGLTSIFSGDTDGGVAQIKEGISGIVDSLSASVPEIVGVGFEIINGLIMSINENLPMLISEGANILLNGVLPGIIENLPTLIETGFSIISELVTAIGEALPELIPAAVSMIIQIVEGLLDNIDMLIDAAISLIMGLVDGIMTALPLLIAKAPEIIGKLVSALIRNLPKIISMAPQIIMSLIQGIISALPDLLLMGPQIIAEIVSGIVSSFQDLFGNGEDMVEQVKAGFSSAVGEAVSWGSDMIQNFINGITAKAQALIGKVKEIAGNIKSFLGFSEPEDGPLSDFHTYAPDMMNLFMKGIDDNKRRLADTVASAFDFENLMTAPSMNMNGVPALAGAGAGVGGIGGGINLYIDGNKLVGATSQKMDRNLGDMQKIRARFGGR